MILHQVFIEHAVLLSPGNSVGGNIVMRLFVYGWVSGCMRLSVSVSVTLRLVGTIQTTVFA